MPAYHVQRSLLIHAEPSTVFDTVADYGTWSKWSPWLTIDKEAVVKVTDDPRSLKSVYSWDGEFVGAGEIEHVELNRSRSISDEIRFTKPFKSKSDVSFEFEPAAGGTKVTWHMKGRLPWFMFWMKSNMQTFIGMDYERGLRMLKEFIETDNVLSDSVVVGVESFESRDVFGARSSAPTNDVGPTMNAAMMKVESSKGSEADWAGVECISVYHPCDLKIGRFDFTVGYTVENPQTAPDGLEHCHIPGGQALHIRHTGSYDNLGNAWSGAHQYARYRKIKLAKRAAFEIYRNSPDTTAAEDLITDIYIPLR